MALFRALNNIPTYRRRIEEARGPDDPPLSDAFLALNSLANFLRILSLMIAYLAKDENTRSELLKTVEHAAERVPAWMELRVFGPDDEPDRKFVLGMAQLLGDQRAMIERIVDEQVEDREPIDRFLDEHSSIPTGAADEDVEELLMRTGLAMQANFQAAMIIARGLDDWIREEQRAEEDEE